MSGSIFQPPARNAVVWQRWVRAVSILAILISVIVLARLLPIGRFVSVLSAKAGQLGIWGPVLFGVVYVLAAVLFVPGSAITLAAGAIFGLWRGTVIVSITSTLAAAASFLVGRYLARDTVQRWARRSPRFAAIDRAIGQGGWKIIALLRLSPAVPFSLGNYLFGLTAVRFWPYVLTSWLAMLPGTFMYVYLGYAGRAGLSAASGASHTRSPAEWALLGVGLAATVVVTVYVTRIAAKAIKEQTAMGPDTASSQANQPPVDSRPQRGPAGTIFLAGTAALLAALAGYGCTNRSLLARLFGPPQVTLDEKYTDSPSGPTLDHSGFDAVMKMHVNHSGFVDYAALKSDSSLLDSYIAALANAPVSEMARNERLALLINAYNAFTLRLILDYYPVKSIRDIPDAKRWDDKRWNIGGQVLSLNQIEHEQVRPNFREPRIHFALVCAAIGCPPLRNEAYSAGRLEEQLQSQAQYVHTHDRWFQYDQDKRIVKLTSLYDWYAGDFEQAAGSNVQFAARFSTPLKQDLEAGHKPTVQFLPYDWSLNSKDNQR